MIWFGDSISFSTYKVPAKNPFFTYDRFSKYRSKLICSREFLGKTEGGINQILFSFLHDWYRTNWNRIFTFYLTLFMSSILELNRFKTTTIFILKFKFFNWWEYCKYFYYCSKREATSWFDGTMLSIMNFSQFKYTCVVSP